MDRSARRWLTWLALVCLFTVSAQTRDKTPTAQLTRTDVPASGRQESLLTVSEFGRYAVTAKSTQGVALQLISKMTGPGSTEGRPGAEDGRLDLFLDRGTYKVVAHAADRGKGTAKLKAHPFNELHRSPPRLEEFKPVSTQLNDFQQRSWWLDIKVRRWVFIEAAGRNLADIRIWKDGSWLIDATPRIDTINPKVGQPLTNTALTAQLNPGLYLVTAYGGPSQPWAQESSEHPMHLRFGVPYIGEAGRKRHVVSPFGFDRFRVSGSANYYRLELPEARPAKINIWQWNESNPLRGFPGRSGSIDKNSVPPVAEVTGGSNSGQSIVSVKAEAGQPYVMQHFQKRWSYSFSGSGDYWLSSIHSGHPTDSIDATALIVESRAKPGPITPFAKRIIDIGARSGWVGKGNLLSEMTIYFNVTSARSYEVVSKGPKAEFRIEPFMLRKPPKYKSPPFRSLGSSAQKVKLDRGVHVLTVRPKKKGIIELAVKPTGTMNPLLEKIGVAGTKKKPVIASVRFDTVRLSRNRNYTVYLNRQPEVSAGLILRKLPLNLTEPLPLTQRPSETVEVPFHSKEQGTVTAEAEDGTLLEMSLDGGGWTRKATVASGTHKVRVRVGGSATVVYSLRETPFRLDPTKPLPPMPNRRLAALPTFDVLTAKQARYYDLDRKEERTVLVSANEPALYRLESTGLLATGGNLRTRTITSFVNQKQNGVGRNFLVQQYLREGDYQLTVSAQGKSKGHLGLTLKKTRLIDGGDLTDGVPGRIQLDAGQAVLYEFEIKEKGRYRLNGFGVGRDFRCRLEDSDGWPIIPVNRTASIDRTFDPGRYRLILMPEPVETRRVTLLEHRPPGVVYKGHGPHSIELGKPVTHTWVEPPDSAAGVAREPDQWEIDIPADIDISLELTNEMDGRLYRIEGAQETEVAYVPPIRGWKGPLTTGRYRLRTQCIRVNNFQEYRLAFWPDQLVRGQARTVSAPTRLPIAVGSDGLIELNSFGKADVRARLYDGDGKLIASGDDRPGDWNFQLTPKLRPGKYDLQIDPVGRSSASVSVSMYAPTENAKGTLALPASKTIQPGGDVHVYPVSPDGKSDVLLAAARSKESVGLAIEGKFDRWTTLGTATGKRAHLEVPLTGERASEYRVRVWSADRRGNPVHFSVSSVKAPRVSARKLGRGATLKAVRGVDPPVGVARVALTEPGVFALSGDSPLRACGAAATACRTVGEGLVPVTGKTMLVVAELSGARSKARVTGTRTTVESDSAVTVRLDPDVHGVVELQPKKRGPVLGIATSMVAQPGIQIGTVGDVKVGAPAMAVGTRAAASVAIDPAKRPAAAIWTAEEVGEAHEVRVEYFEFAKPRVAPARWGRFHDVLKAGTAQAHQLPSGGKTVRIVASRGVFAVLSSGPKIDSVHWNGGEAFDEVIMTHAQRLTFLQPRGEGRASVEVRERLAPRLPLEPGDPYEGTHAEAGTLVLEASVPRGSGQPHIVRIRGDLTGTPVLIHNDGTVQRGTDLPMTDGLARLLVPHKSGGVLAWVDPPTENGNGLFAKGTEGGKNVVPPATVDFAAARSQVLRIVERPGDALVHVRTTQPVISRVTGQKIAPRIDVHPAGGLLAFYMPAGAGAHVTLRPLGGGPLHGSASLSVTAVTPVKEGLGPEVLLGAGSTRLFSFEVGTEGPIGIGVRADSDHVECVVMNARGQEIGTGVVQMPVLESGSYLLALRVPPDGRPVRARAALAGLERPDTGPPDEVVRKYLELAGITPTGGVQ